MEDPAYSMKKVEPYVGIFFLVGDRVMIDATPLSEAGVYAGHLIHEGGHPEFWESLGIDGEYDAFPRGRVALDTRTGKFHAACG